MEHRREDTLRRRKLSWKKLEEKVGPRIDQKGSFGSYVFRGRQTGRVENYPGNCQEEGQDNAPAVNNPPPGSGKKQGVARTEKFLWTTYSHLVTGSPWGKYLRGPR